MGHLHFHWVAAGYVAQATAIGPISPEYVCPTDELLGSPIGRWGGQPGIATGATRCSRFHSVSWGLGGLL